MSETGDGVDDVGHGIRGHGHSHDHGHTHGHGPDHRHGWDLEVTDDLDAPTVQGANDVVDLQTVGLDVGSSTSHVSFGHIRLERLAQSLSSQFVVTHRSTRWRSPIVLTPYTTEDTIDEGALGEFFGECFEQAGVRPDQIDTGVVILTGEALKRRNAKAIASLFAGQSGRFVCAVASHHRESVMAALGSGAASLSRDTGRLVLNVDVGGGTTKLALLADGEVLQTAAFAVGGRLLVQDDDGRVVVVAEPMRTIAAAAGVPVDLGAVVTSADVATLVSRMVDVVVEHVTGAERSALAEELLVTEPLTLDSRLPDVVTFSGGVAEYVYGRELGAYGDLGPLLGEGLRAACAEARIPYELFELPQGIRATVVGLSQFSVQVSGNTVSLGEDDGLPLRNVPVLRPLVDLSEWYTDDDVARALITGEERADVIEDAPLAVAFEWSGDPEYGRLARLAEGIRAGVAGTRWGRSTEAPLVVLVDADVARSLGRILEHETELNRSLICLDGIEVADCDYVDVGQMLEPGKVVPVIVKSLLFDAVHHDGSHAETPVRPAGT